MSRYVIEISQEKENRTIWIGQWRVAIAQSELLMMRGSKV